jgi:hypothetical protein
MPNEEGNRLELLPVFWSLQTHVRVGGDGKVPLGHHLPAIAAPPRSTVLRCLD